MKNADKYNYKFISMFVTKIKTKIVKILRVYIGNGMPDGEKKLNIVMQPAKNLYIYLLLEILISWNLYVYWINKAQTKSIT